VIFLSALDGPGKTAYTVFMKNFLIEMRTDFTHPEAELDFHWWRQNKTSLHRHDFFEFFLIVQGEVMHELNGARSVIEKNTLYLIRPDDVHMFEPKDGQPSQHINVSVSAPVMETLCNLLDPDLFGHINQNALTLWTTLGGSEFNYFSHLAQHLVGLRSSSVAALRVGCKQMIINALATLLRGNVAGQNYPAWFSSLLRQIKSPEFLACGAKDVYRIGHYSPPSLVRYFKEYTGKTVVEYLTARKIAFACNALKKTNLTVLDISNRLGYGSLSHFNRVFKALTGKTPTEYRRG
jgi:AraC family cel operon transcriptional repressor